MQEKEQALNRGSLWKAKWKRFYKTYSTQFSIFVALVIFVIVIALLSPYFLTPTNLSNISVYMTVTGTMAVGLTIVMLLGGIDLSQMSAMACSVMATGMIIDGGHGPYLAILVGLLVGVTIGVVNGFIITKMKIIPMIATIGMSMVYRAIANISTNAKWIMIDDPVFKFLGYGRVLGIPVLFLIMIFIYALAYFFLKYTATGRAVYAVGGNLEAAYLSGIKVNRVKMTGYVISGAITGISGIIWTAQMSASMATAGNGMDLDVIAAVIMGGVGLGGGKGNIVGSLLGICILTVFSNAMTLLNIQAFYQQLLKGLILIAAVYIDTLRNGGYKL